MYDQCAPLDQRLAELASRQHGVVTVAQLRELGFDKHRVHSRVRTGRMHSVHRGVYAVGHAGLSHESEWMAAVLASGPGAVLSHMSAAALWGLLRSGDGPVDVSLPSHSGRRRRRGIRLHRRVSLAALPSWTATGAPVPLTTVRRGIPVTTVARTINDLDGTASPKLVRRAIREAQQRGIKLDAPTAARTRGTRSDLEIDFLAFCERHRLLLPEVNVKVGRWEVDFLWRRQRLAVETDFYDYHRGSISFEDDHQRDLDLRRLGYRVRRYTGAQIRNHPALVVADLGEVLGGAR
jgi:very-short-patch-repair endonuclease